MPFLISLLLAIVISHASEFDTYRATLTKGSFCTVSGGACAGDTDFDSGFFQNPASLAASGATFDFDFDFDVKSEPNPDLGSSPGDSRLRTSFAALGWSGEQFALAIAYNEQLRESESAHYRQTEIDLPLALQIAPKWILGLGLGLLNSSLNNGDVSPQWTIQVKAGALYQVRKNLSLGSWLLLPSAYKISEDTYHSPLQWQTGAEWKPELSRIYYLAQIDVLGTSSGGEVDSYSAPSVSGAAKGRQVAVQPHLGLRTPFARDSRWNLYAGTYYEVSRVDSVEGREHLTGGLSYKLPLPYKFWDVVEFMAGVDVAKDYDQVILTFR